MWLAIAGGLALLTVGAEWLVRGASRLAALAGVAPLVVGLTVVAYGTSAPELAVSVKSAVGGQSDIALGNVVGSNIFNVLFILGVCALVQPLRVHSQLVRTDVPIMILASFLALGMSLDSMIGRIDGILLVGGAISYTVFTIRKSGQETKDVQDEFRRLIPKNLPSTVATAARALAVLVAGLAALVIGSRFFVNGAVDLARHFGASELVIGLTIVAAGTSMPEVATSVVASLRGERDIAIGNVVGSNIFNILAVLGCSSLVRGIPVAAPSVEVDIPVMVGVAVACLPIFFTGLEIRRWEGALFLSFYVAYTAYLIMHATDYGALPAYREIMFVFVLPLTAITLTVLAVHEWRRGYDKHSGPRDPDPSR